MCDVLKVCRSVHNENVLLLTKMAPTVAYYQVLLIKLLGYLLIKHVIVLLLRVLRFDKDCLFTGLVFVYVFNYPYQRF